MKKHVKRYAVGERVEQWLDLPTGALTPATRMEVSGNRRIVIEGCQGILEYNEDCIRLRVCEGVLRLFGRGLCMNCLNPLCAVITGNILSLEFL